MYLFILRGIKTEILIAETNWFKKTYLVKNKVEL